MMPTRSVQRNSCRLIRHGETDWNRVGRLQGHTDIPLNVRGRAQAEALAQKLACEAVDSIVTSPLTRARETAAILAGERDCPILEDERLLEIDHGPWQGLTAEEIQERFPRHWELWEETPARLDLPAGESLHSVARRIRSFLEEARSGHNIWAVTHGVVLQVVQVLTSRLPLDEIHRFRLANISTFRVRFRPDSDCKWKFDRLP